MKPLIAVILTVLSTNASAVTAIVQGEAAVSCRYQHYLEDFIQIAVAEDWDSVNAYIDKGKCRWLNKGDQVTLLGTFQPPIVEFMIKGEREFTWYRDLFVINP